MYQQIIFAAAILAVRAGKSRDRTSIGPRTKIGALRVGKGDIVVVREPGEASRLAVVTDAYQVGAVWRVRLAPPPHVTPAPRVPQSTKLRNVRGIYRRGPQR